MHEGPKYEQHLIRFKFIHDIKRCYIKTLFKNGDMYRPIKPKKEKSKSQNKDRIVFLFLTVNIHLPAHVHFRDLKICWRKNSNLRFILLEPQTRSHGHRPVATEGSSDLVPWLMTTHRCPEQEPPARWGGAADIIQLSTAKAGLRPPLLVRPGFHNIP